MKWLTRIKSLWMVFVAFTLCVSSAFAQDYLINRGTIVSNNSPVGMCVVDKNEYYAIYMVSGSTNKAVVTRYKNGISSRYGTTGHWSMPMARITILQEIR